MPEAQTHDPKVAKGAVVSSKPNAPKASKPWINKSKKKKSNDYTGDWSMAKIDHRIRDQLISQKFELGCGTIIVLHGSNTGEAIARFQNFFGPERQFKVVNEE